MNINLKVRTNYARQLLEHWSTRWPRAVETGLPRAVARTPSRSYVARGVLSAVGFWARIKEASFAAARAIWTGVLRWTNFNNGQRQVSRSDTILRKYTENEFLINLRKSISRVAPANIYNNGALGYYAKRKELCCIFLILTPLRASLYTFINSFIKSTASLHDRNKINRKK